MTDEASSSLETRQLSDTASAVPLTLCCPSLPESVRLENNEIHIWCATLSDFDSELPRFQAILSPAEQTRAERFRFSKDGINYVTRRGVRRLILARYLEQHPAKIAFCQGRFGKPEIKACGLPSALHFNDSHSGDLAIYAVTQDGPIGVDVEHLRPVPNFEAIASRFFSPRETEMLRSLPAESRIEGFFACWTRKEAFLKATGEGIGEGLARVEVTLAPREEPQVLHLAGDFGTQTGWQLRSFSPSPGYLGAIAFKDRSVSLSQWTIHAPLH